MTNRTQQEITHYLASQHTMLATLREQFHTLHHDLTRANVTLSSEIAAQFAAVEAQIHASELANNQIEALLADTADAGFKDTTQADAERVLHSISEGVIVLDTQGRVTFFNPAAEQLLSVAAPALLGKPLTSLAEKNATQEDHSHARLISSYLAPELAIADDQGVSSAVLELIDPPQTIIVKRAPLVDNAHARGEVIVLYDLSAETSLAQAKTDFIATISHELRTPLTIIFGNLDLLLRGYSGELNVEQSEMLTHVRKCAGNIRDVVSNMIMIASLQANTLLVDIQPQDIFLIIESVLAPMRDAFAARGISVMCDIPTDLPLLYTDRELLRLVLLQLLDNARRYTEHGEVRISVRVAETRIRVDIADTGSGITPKMQQRLFTRFQRTEGNTSTERGAGLGLAITRQIIERLHGEIWVASTPGEGSVFSFALPLMTHEA